MTLGALIVTRMAVTMAAFDKLLSDGQVPEASAQPPAEEAGGYQSRLAGVEARLQRLTGIVGTLVALAVGNLGLAFGILARLPK
jgi:hypothetical protein